MNENKPLVSVIMSEFNTNEELLVDSINSILNQTYKNFEFIIIDDCGRNDLNEIINKIDDKRIKYYKNDKNMGLVYSLNKAIKMSNGKYIARMDTDDYAYPDRLELEVDFLEKNKNIDIISSRADFYDGKDIWGESKFFGKVDRKIILKGSPLIHPATMYKKTAIDKIGGYLNYYRCEDYATWIELFINGYNFYVIENKTLRYHLCEDDYKKRTLKMRKEFFKMFKEQYIKLNPSRIEYYKMYIKNIVAGLIPGHFMFIYHKKKGKLINENK